MVFFQLNVTGLLFQSFRTASPQQPSPLHAPMARGGGKEGKEAH